MADTAAAAATASSKLQFGLRRMKKPSGIVAAPPIIAANTSTGNNNNSSSGGGGLVIPMARNPATCESETPLLLRCRRRFLRDEHANDDDDEDEDARVRKEVAMLPDQASAAAYERVPVADFGAGLLRGMGWSDGAKIGLSNAALVKPLEAIRRPHRLGLGAKIALPLPEAARRDASGRLDRRYEDSNSKKQGLKVGDNVEIVSGAHKSLLGVVHELYQGGTRAKVRLSASNEIVSMSSRRILPISSSRKRAAKRSRDFRDEETDESNGKALQWVRPNLLVRVCSKSVDEGRQYRRKARVLDVVSRVHFSVVTDEGRVLERLRERDVETVVGRESGAALMVVAGRHRGERGTLLKRDVSKQNAIVALGEHGDCVKKFHLDHVCQVAENQSF